jgi:hypothetical protein
MLNPSCRPNALLCQKIKAYGMHGRKQVKSIGATAIPNGFIFPGAATVKKQHLPIVYLFQTSGMHIGKDTLLVRNA